MIKKFIMGIMALALLTGCGAGGSGSYTSESGHLTKSSYEESYDDNNTESINQDVDINLNMKSTDFDNDVKKIKKETNSLNVFSYALPIQVTVLGGVSSFFYWFFI